jgi:quercetin dioxygenase-like cupin family protein
LTWYSGVEDFRIAATFVFDASRKSSAVRYNDLTMIIKAQDRLVKPSPHGLHVRKEVLVTNGAAPPITQVAVSTIEPQTAVEMHQHATMWEFFFVLSGAATYFLDDEEFDVGSGDLFVVPPGKRHGQKAQDAPHTVLHWGVATD